MSNRIIANAKLDRIERDMARATMLRTHDSSKFAGFRYDHGNISVRDDKGGETLLFLHEHEPMKYNAARLIHHCDPSLLKELVYGYRLAKKAGLLEAPRTNGALDELRKNPEPEKA